MLSITYTVEKSECLNAWKGHDGEERSITSKYKNWNSISFSYKLSDDESLGRWAKRSNICSHII